MFLQIICAIYNKLNSIKGNEQYNYFDKKVVPVFFQKITINFIGTSSININFINEVGIDCNIDIE